MFALYRADVTACAGDRNLKSPDAAATTLLRRCGCNRAARDRPRHMSRRAHRLLLELRALAEEVAGGPGGFAGRLLHLPLHVGLQQDGATVSAWYHGSPTAQAAFQSDRMLAPGEAPLQQSRWCGFDAGGGNTQQFL